MKDLQKREGQDAATRGAGGDVAAFLRRAAETRPASGETGRLIFALDATMSRQPTWDAACNLQADMFRAVGEAGREGGALSVQLVYFRSHAECRASRWVSDTGALADLMSGLECRGGLTQIGKVLLHARKEAAKRSDTGARVNALVFVGDAMEEDVDAVSHRAGELALLGVPAFMFQEGRDGATERAFREIARLSGGAFMRFDSGAADELGRLLRAVARYASGGRRALENAGRTEQLLLEQMR